MLTDTLLLTHPHPQHTQWVMLQNHVSLFFLRAILAERRGKMEIEEKAVGNDRECGESGVGEVMW